MDIRGAETQPALLLGIDPFSEGPLRDYRFVSGSGLDQEAFLNFLTRPGWVMLSAPLAARLHLGPGDTFTAAVGARVRQLHVAGIFRTPGNLYPLDGAVLLMDLGQAQEMLDRTGRLDYVDLIVHGDLAAAAEQVRQALPPGVEITTPGAQAQYMAGLVGAYRLNLSVLSAIALFVGMFLIYQSVTLSVVRRRREIGLLRTLGMTRGQVMLLFLLEGALSGALGGLLGLVLGAALAQAALGMVAQNLTSLYQPVPAGEIWLEGRVFFQAWGLAVAATLLASWVPAREASRTKVRAVWYQRGAGRKTGRVGHLQFLSGSGGSGAGRRRRLDQGRPWDSLAGFSLGFSHPPGFCPVHAPGGLVAGPAVVADVPAVTSALPAIWAAATSPVP